MIKLLAPGQVYVDYGPVQMTITARRHGKSLSKEAEQAGSLVPKILKDLAEVLPVAKQPWPNLTHIERLPKVLRLMTKAVSATGDETLTPMAAVAGAFADLVADFLIDRKATKVIVNNGGDIAIRLKSGENTRVGIAPRVGERNPTHYLPLKSEDRTGGVATSGLGGRSMTLGIADAVTVAAQTAVLADACATLVANHTNVEGPFIERRFARDINPDTDIPNLRVTTRVGPLSESAINEALDRGLSKAKELIEARLIHGSIIFVAGKVLMWPAGFAKVLSQPESSL